MNDNVFKSIINYRNNLYKNDAKAFSYIPVWAGQVQNLIKNGMHGQKNILIFKKPGDCQSAIP